MLRAFAHARERDPSARLRIAGLGVPDAAFHRLVDQLGIAGSIEFLGERDDVPALLEACDGVVLSSRSEGLPNAVLESMARRRGDRTPVGIGREEAA